MDSPGIAAEIAIHPATEGDFEALYRLYREFHQYLVEAVPSRLRGISEDDPQDRARFREALTFIFEEEGAITICLSTMFPINLHHSD